MLSPTNCVGVLIQCDPRRQLPDRLKFVCLGQILLKQQALRNVLSHEDDISTANP